MNRVVIRPVSTTKIRVNFLHDLPSVTGVTELMVWGTDPFAISR